jgi:hypothetical protein
VASTEHILLDGQKATHPPVANRMTRCPPQPADSSDSQGDFVTSAGLPTGASDKQQRKLLGLFTYRLPSMHCMAVDIATAAPE